MNDTQLDKSADLKEAIKICTEVKQQNKKIVFTNGCFDIIHAGHVTYLQQAKNLGDFLVLGLNSDHSVRALKGKKRPLVPQKDRITVLSALSMIDLIIVFDDLVPNNIIKALEPNIHVKGGDYQIKKLPEYKIVKEYGGKIEILPFVPGASTTGLINNILDKYRI